MDNWLIVAWLIVGALLVFLLEQYRQTRRLEAGFADRASLVAEEFATFFFLGEQVAVAEKLRALLEPHLSMDIGKLRPDDRFGEDLHIDELDSLAANEFVLEIKKELGVAIPDEVAENLLTFRQVVEYVTQNLPADKQGTL